MFKKIYLAMLSILLILVTINTTYADDTFTNPMIVKVENGQIVVNQGFYENIGNNQIFTVKHGNDTIGKIRVKELYEHYCICEPLDNITITSISKGDSAIPESKSTKNNTLNSTNNDSIKNTVNNSISKEEKKLSERELAKQKREEEKTLREAKKLEEKQKKEAEEAEKNRLAEIEEKKQAIQDEYIEKLADCTRTVSFSKKTGHKHLGIPSKILYGLTLYNFVDNYITMSKNISKYGGRHMLGRRLTYLPETMGTAIKRWQNDDQRSYKLTQQYYGTEIEIVFFTPELIRSQARMLALGDDAYDDEQQINAIADGMIQQNEIDQYAVFQVTITNDQTSADSLQLAPFKWKMVIITDTNEEVKAIKYDEALDKTLGPGQTVTGNIYFPLTDSMGNKLGMNNTRVRFQSILDKKLDIKWSDKKGRPDTSKTKNKNKKNSKKNKK